MKTSDFVKILQDELILQRDPHIAERFAALLDEYYVPRFAENVRVQNAADGVNVVAPLRGVAAPSRAVSNTAWTPNSPMLQTGLVVTEGATWTPEPPRV